MHNTSIRRRFFCLASSSANRRILPASVTSASVMSNT